MAYGSGAFGGDAFGGEVETVAPPAWPGPEVCGLLVAKLVSYAAAGQLPDYDVQVALVPYAVRERIPSCVP